MTSQLIIPSLPEVNSLIMLELDDASLAKIFCSSKRLSLFSQDNEFWRLKLNRRFSVVLPRKKELYNHMYSALLLQTDTSELVIMIRAIYFGFNIIAKKLLIDNIDRVISNPAIFAYAVKSSNTDIVSFLLNLKGDDNVPVFDNEMINLQFIHGIHTCRNPELIIDLMTNLKVLDVNYANEIALTLCFMSNNIKAASYLISKGANIYNPRAFIVPAVVHNLELLKEIVEQMYITDHMDDALLVAAQHGHLSAIEYLVENGADIIGNRQQMLYRAADTPNGATLSVFKYLCDFGADITENNGEALLLAVMNERADVFDYLRNDENIDNIYEIVKFYIELPNLQYDKEVLLGKIAKFCS